ncbi:MAG: transposase [Planctomycetota bacterium]
MARRPRIDAPGCWHHVGNRAIAKRPYFESRSDQRAFLALLAKQVRAGRFEVHAYCLMTTHFHLLVRSPIGELSEAMRRLQSAYARHFNRRQKRDGPLIRGRFFSKRVETDSYRGAVVRYIDANPVRARMVATAAEYEFGSARAYLGDRRPRWLRTDWVERRALDLADESRSGRSAYLHAFGTPPGRSVEAVIDLVEARLRSVPSIDPIDDLIGKTPAQVRTWLARKALLADGHRIGMPVCGQRTVLLEIADAVERGGDRVLRRGGVTWSGSEVMRVGLLRDLAALTIARIGHAVGLKWAATKRRLELHREHLEGDAEYAAWVARVAKDAIDRAG